MLTGLVLRIRVNKKEKIIGSWEENKTFYETAARIFLPLPKTTSVDGKQRESALPGGHTDHVKVAQ